jgi:hypothetical protein
MEDIAQALLLHRNYIETGTVTMSANDAVNSKQHKLIKALEPSQKAKIARLEVLAAKFLAAASKKSMEEIDKKRPGSMEAALAECQKWRMTDEEVEKLLE